MALIKTEGIVLKSKKYSETSLILDIYTETLGMKSYIISGIRKSKSKMAGGIYQLMQIVDIVAYDKANNSLCRIKEGKAAYFYKTIPYEIQKSSIGMLLTEISHNAIKEQEENPQLYHFLKDWFIHIDDCETSLGFKPVQFMIELSQLLGFYPDNNYDPSRPLFNMQEGAFVPPETNDPYCLNKEESQALLTLMKSDKNTVIFENISNSTKASLMNSMILYYRLHLSNFKDLKSITILRQVLM